VIHGRRKHGGTSPDLRYILRDSVTEALLVRTCPRCPSRSSASSWICLLCVNGEGGECYKQAQWQAITNFCQLWILPRTPHRGEIGKASFPIHSKSLIFRKRCWIGKNVQLTLNMKPEMPFRIRHYILPSTTPSWEIDVYKVKKIAINSESVLISPTAKLIISHTRESRSKALQFVS